MNTMSFQDSFKPQLRTPDTYYARKGKRLLDIFFSLILLPLIVPVILVMALVVKLDGGPVFFGHKRIGMGGTIYRCWKIRTMSTNAESRIVELCNNSPDIAAEWELYQKLKDDPRISKVGKVLRATRLDELPQVWNVLTGQMSFVGPRPFTPDQQSTYLAHGGLSYFAIRPGITGSWQVRRNPVSAFTQRITFDEDYAKKISFLTDMKIILKTLKIMKNFDGN